MTSGATAGLALHDAAARARELLLERARLLRDIQRKKRQLEQFRLRALEQAQQTTSRMRPLIERHERLRRELTALLAELLAEGRLGRRLRKEVQLIQAALVLQGVLTPLDGSEEHEDQGYDDGAPWTRGGEPDAGWTEHAEPAVARSPAEVAGAAQVGQKRRTLRELFRSLARAIHPDQARHDTEREQRTAVMKEVTRAYEDGDLARLIELETSWQSEQVLSGSGEPELRCRELLRVNRELLDQVRQLTRELRDAKRQARDETMGVPPDELIEQASLELDQLHDVCDVLRRLRDGQLTLADLQVRPPPRRSSRRRGP